MHNDIEGRTYPAALQIEFCLFQFRPGKRELGPYTFQLRLAQHQFAVVALHGLVENLKFTLRNGLLPLFKPQGALRLRHLAFPLQYGELVVAGIDAQQFITAAEQAAGLQVVADGHDFPADLRLQCH